MSVRDLITSLMDGEPLRKAADVTDHHLHTEIVYSGDDELSILVTVEDNDHEVGAVMKFLMTGPEATEMGEILSRQGATASAMQAMIEIEEDGAERVVSPSFEVPEFTL